MTRVFINAVGTAVPPHDMHRKFLGFAPMILGDDRKARLLARMAERAGVDHRYSVLAPHPEPGRIDAGDVYRRGGFPNTRVRMRLYEENASALALRAVEALGIERMQGVSHLILSSCTGFTGPGVDVQVALALGLDPAVERTVVGFMGCSAALNALRLARHTVRSDPAARVLVLNLELCTLHFQETEALEEMLSYLIFADGCAASVVSAEPEGVELGAFSSAVVPDTTGHITWQIGEAGFLMHLSGELPAAVTTALHANLRAILGGLPEREVALWAVHPGGRSILDAVERAMAGPIDLSASREVLRQYGNMSSPTIMFVLQRMMADPAASGEGCLLAFGPGVSVEAARFRKLAA